MKLNKKGFAPMSLLLAFVALAVSVILTLPRNNNYADIPMMKATKTTLSDYERVKLQAGQEFRIIGVDKSYSKRDKKTQIMLLVQTDKGERDLFNPDLISDEELQSILPSLKKSEFSNSPAIFCRKTISRKAIDAIPLGISLEEMDAILVPTDRVVTEDGVQKAIYFRMEVFDKASGKFYRPTMKFKDGAYCGCDLETYRKTHLNAWLLKFLPGTQWVYDHNLFNLEFQKKAFGKLKVESDDEGKVVIDASSGFFAKLLALVILLVLVVVIFGYYVLIPLLPAYMFYGLLTFPPLFKLFNRTLTNIIVIALVVLCYYYCWLTFMPYMSFFLMPCIMVPAAMYGIGFLMSDDICRKCKYMNTKVLDHSEVLGERITSRKESGNRRKIGSRQVGTRHTWKETKEITTDRNTNQVVGEHTTKSDHKYFKDYEDTYETDRYNCVYLVKTVKYYYRCEECGNITSWIHDEWELQSKDFVGTTTSTQARSEEY